MRDISKGIKKGHAMANPLFTLAKRLDDRAAEKRTRRAIADIEQDLHLARDVALPYRPQPKRRVDLW